MYGFVIPADGVDHLASLLAGETLTITRVMVGSGKFPDEGDTSKIKDLVEPVAEATTTVPVINAGVCSFIVEYRSDMNGGLETGFWLNEYGVFVEHPTKGEILLYYGMLGDYPQYVSPLSPGIIDTRRFPVSIAVTTGVQVEIIFTPGASMSADDVAEALAFYALKVHAHDYGDINGLQAAIDEILSAADNSGDLSDLLFALTTLQSSLDTHTNAQNPHTDSEPKITAGTTAQYWSGNKTWQTLNAAAVGLNNVNNTSDANKPVSSAQATAIGAKAETKSGTAVLPASGWTNNTATTGYHTIIVAASGILATDEPIVGPIKTGTDANADDLTQDAWNCLSRVAANAANQLQFYAKTVPSVAVQFQWKVVR